MVNHILSTPDEQEKRVCQRLELNRQVQIKLADGQLIKGLTEDISLGGLRVVVSESFAELDVSKINSRALLQFTFIDGQLSPEFLCTIVRCDPGSFCLKLDKKKAASFGMMLTRGALKKKNCNQITALKT